MSHSWCVWWKPSPIYDISGKEQLTIIQADSEQEAREKFLALDTYGTICRIKDCKGDE